MPIHVSISISLTCDLSTLLCLIAFSVSSFADILPERLAAKIRSFFETSISLLSDQEDSSPTNDAPFPTCCGAFPDESSFPSHGNFKLPYPSSLIPELAKIQSDSKIKGSWVLPYAHKSGMSRKLNQDILEVCESLRECGLEPVAGFTCHPSDGKEEVLKTAKEAIRSGSKVSKLHCSVGSYGVMHEAFSDYWKLAEEIQFPVVVHLGTSTTGHTTSPEVEELEILLKKHPKLKLILAHSGSPAVMDAIHLAKRYSNLYLDTTPTVTRSVPFPQPSSEAYEDVMGLARKGRILMGTDLPNVSQKLERTIRDTVYVFGDDQDRKKLGDGDSGWMEMSEELRKKGEGNAIYELLCGAAERLVKGVRLDLIEGKRGGKL